MVFCMKKYMLFLLFSAILSCFAGENNLANANMSCFSDESYVDKQGELLCAAIDKKMERVYELINGGCKVDASCIMDLLFYINDSKLQDIVCSWYDSSEIYNALSRRHGPIFVEHICQSHSQDNHPYRLAADYMCAVAHGDWKCMCDVVSRCPNFVSICPRLMNEDGESVFALLCRNDMHKDNAQYFICAVNDLYQAVRVQSLLLLPQYMVLLLELLDNFCQKHIPYITQNNQWNTMCAKAQEEYKRFCTLPFNRMVVDTTRMIVVQRGFRSARVSNANSSLLCACALYSQNIDFIDEVASSYEERFLHLSKENRNLLAEIVKDDIDRTSMMMSLARNDDDMFFKCLISYKGCVLANGRIILAYSFRNHVPAKYLYALLQKEREMITDKEYLLAVINYCMYCDIASNRDVNVAVLNVIKRFISIKCPQDENERKDYISYMISEILDAKLLSHNIDIDELVEYVSQSIEIVSMLGDDALWSADVFCSSVLLVHCTAATDNQKQCVKRLYQICKALKFHPLLDMFLNVRDMKLRNFLCA